MDSLNQHFKTTAVVGAAGKMGSGIALLLLQALAKFNETCANDEYYTLYLIDSNGEALVGLRHYLESQVQKHAEKNYKHKVSCSAGTSPTEDCGIQEYVEQVLSIAHFSTDISDAYDVGAVFEACPEDLELKKQILSKIKNQSKQPPYFFTNTSSIPIHILNDTCQLDHRIIGFHFYNPPAVQTLVEIITTPDTPAILKAMAEYLGGQLGKTLIPSSDVAGFIGNGHFIREIIFACEQIEDLRRNFSPIEVIYMVNRCTQDYMLRPMGIFQLIDYVGIDVCQQIFNVMRKYSEEKDLYHPLLAKMLSEDIRGGQYSDGSQKDGFFQYEKNRPTGIYSLSQSRYIPFSEGAWKEDCDNALGPLPDNFIPWKKLMKEENCDAELAAHFHDLSVSESFGSYLASHFLKQSQAIADNLIRDGVAANLEDITHILKKGFLHLYGPEKDYYI